MFHIILNMQSIGAYPSRAIASKHLVAGAYIVAPCVWEAMQMTANAIRVPQKVNKGTDCDNCGRKLGNHIKGLNGVYCSDDCMRQAGDSEEPPF